MQHDPELLSRAERHAALGDPIRLAIAEELIRSDRSPIELLRLTGIASNLMAHHLDVLEQVGLITRSRSSGDGRRRYIHLHREALADLSPGAQVVPQPVLFVCTHNSPRSQLAAALWEQLTDAPSTSAGTHPSEHVHRGAIAAAKRAGLDLSEAQPRSMSDLDEVPTLVVTVCDRAHEELDPELSWLHWSVPDPVPVGTKAAFDDATNELRDRIVAMTGVRP